MLRREGERLGLAGALVAQDRAGGMDAVLLTARHWATFFLLYNQGS